MHINTNTFYVGCVLVHSIVNGTESLCDINSGSPRTASANRMWQSASAHTETHHTYTLWMITLTCKSVKRGTLCIHTHSGLVCFTRLCAMCSTRRGILWSARQLCCVMGAGGESWWRSQRACGGHICGLYYRQTHKMLSTKSYTHTQTPPAQQHAAPIAFTATAHAHTNIAYRCYMDNHRRTKWICNMLLYCVPDIYIFITTRRREHTRKRVRRGW